MKGSKLVETLKEIINDDEGCYYSDLGYEGLSTEIQEAIEKKLGPFKYVLVCDRPFGEEDTQRTVVHFTDHDVYVAVDGYYDSWSGGNFDDAEPYQVCPVEKTYTDWVAVK